MEKTYKVKISLGDYFEHIVELEAKDWEEVVDYVMGQIEVIPVDDGGNEVDLSESDEVLCGNCSRPHTNPIVAGISRCDRCKDL